jgi:hypothetical protein
LIIKKKKIRNEARCPFMLWCWFITYFSLDLHVRRSNSFTVGKFTTLMVIIRSYQNGGSFQILLELEMFNNIECGKRSYNLPVHENEVCSSGLMNISAR